MENSFKIGDIVKCIKHESEKDSRLYKIGKEYEVLDRGLMKDSILISEENHCCSPSQDCFVLVKAKQLSDIEIEFYKIYDNYEKLYLICYPDRIHPYQQTKYFKMSKCITECDIQLLNLKISELNLIILGCNKNKTMENNMHKDFIQYPLQHRLYRHYKGGIYEVLFLAKDDNNETMVVYQSKLYGSYHTKPLKVFNELVDVEVPDTNIYRVPIEEFKIEKVKRFEIYNG